MYPSNCLNEADVLLHLHLVFLRILVGNLTSLNVLFVADLGFVAAVAVGLEGIRCRNTSFFLCHPYLICTFMF